MSAPGAKQGIAPYFLSQQLVYAPYAIWGETAWIGLYLSIQLKPKYKDKLKTFIRNKVNKNQSL